MRKRRKLRRGPPRWLFACLGVCLLVLILFPLAHRFGWFRTRRGPLPPPAAAAVAPPVPDPASQQPVDLALSEVHPRVEGAARRLEGQVRNNSSSRYENVQVFLTIRSRSGARLGTVTGRIDSIAPKSMATFRTGDLPDGAFRHTLREITGTRK